MSDGRRARGFISPKRAGAPIYSHHRGPPDPAKNLRVSAIDCTSVSSSCHVIPPNLSIHVLLSRHAPVCVLFAMVIISSMVFLHFLIATDVLDDQQVVSLTRRFRVD